MRSGVIRKAGLVLAAFACALAAPAAAQFSDSYNFLKAVKERDGNEATKFLNQPGTTIVNTRDLSNGETALHIVIQRRDDLWARFLLERGANPNIADRSGVTPLALAASLGFVEGVDRLLKAGARIDVSNAAGETPLISAVHRRDFAIVRLLLKNGADPDRTDNSGRSARDYATLMGAAGGVLQEIERAEAERKEAGADQGTYGPGL
ncbi:ankyrin repeat domain-containing protein [Tsuneonella sp. YG55]|uniref:Ankyrin repeat domain-containing protein n=1 Tax=Tsuneonella litorea TaxID=2976475 RepID=A0A9X2VYA0_9SPHN|nr:ankyrin repeat domain-containing protein [Tsuneonella litorea]MCT2557407.1 ankyrin repeat domain-containing protein [Tsuneonella litorea]